MNQVHGGERQGAGRKPGAINKATAEAKAMVEATGETPLDYMIRIMRDPEVDVSRRGMRARASRKGHENQTASLWLAASSLPAQFVGFP
jgi:23S rRNA maturation mini-RNase III